MYFIHFTAASHYNGIQCIFIHNMGGGGVIVQEYNCPFILPLKLKKYTGIILVSFVNFQYKNLSVGLCVNSHM